MPSECWINSRLTVSLLRFSVLKPSDVRVSWVSKDERAVDLTDLLRMCDDVVLVVLDAGVLIARFGAKFNCHVNSCCLVRLARIDWLVGVRFCGNIIGLGLRGSSLISLRPLNSSIAGR